MAVKDRYRTHFNYFIENGRFLEAPAARSFDDLILHNEGPGLCIIGVRQEGNTRQITNPGGFSTQLSAGEMRTLQGPLPETLTFTAFIDNITLNFHAHRRIG